MTRIWILSFAIALCAGCGSERTTPGEALLGRWSMDRVLEEGTDVTAEHNPEGDRWIMFTPDGAFVSDGSPFGRNTGQWTLDPATQELYLDSDAGEGDDSYWTIAIEGDTMRWAGARSEFAERFVLLYTRKSAP